jgi:hypothetical protein
MLYKKLMASPEGNWAIESLLVYPSALLGETVMRPRPNTANIAIATAFIRSVMKDNSEITRPSDADDPISPLVDSLRRLEIEREGQFFGESSGEVFLRTAVEQKNEHMGNKDEFRDPKKPVMRTQRPEFWTLSPVR